MQSQSKHLFAQDKNVWCEAQHINSRDELARVIALVASPP